MAPLERNFTSPVLILVYFEKKFCFLSGSSDNLFFLFCDEFLVIFDVLW
jgi:hypothetical protein